MCEREREGERQREGETERGRDRERARERECERKGERDGEREGERVGGEEKWVTGSTETHSDTLQKRSCHSGLAAGPSCSQLTHPLITP